MNNPKIFALLMITFNSLFSQKIDNVVCFRDMSSDNYLRFNFDNDFFTSNDKNYTGGYNLEVVTSQLKKNPLNYLFFKPKNGKNKYGLCLEQIVFTPDDIKSTEIQIGDRPFAVAIMLKSFLITTDTVKKSRFICSLNIGLIGPSAFGKEIQTGVHKFIGAAIPRGWKNQIQNNIVVNYEVCYEKQIIGYNNLFSLQTNSTLRLGTLFTNASVGLSTTLGIINTPFSSTKKNRKLQVYIYSQLIGSSIGYDATLQGGLLDNSCFYVISDDDIERFTAQHNYGIILQSKNCYLEYSLTSITREFKSGSAADWGGIKFGVIF